MGVELDRLETEITEIKNVVDAAIVLIRGITSQLRDAIAAGNPAKLTELADGLDAKAAEFADALVENTPVDPNEE